VPTPAEMVELLDAQIAAEMRKPEAMDAAGKSVRRRNLEQLLATRKYYAKLAGVPTLADPGILVTPLRPGGPT